MKLTFNVQGKTQPDPFIFEDGGRLYLYVTAEEGVDPNVERRTARVCKMTVSNGCIRMERE